MDAEKVGATVVLFRKEVLLDFKRDLLQRELEKAIDSLTPEEFGEYMKLTQEIERAADEAEEYANAASLSPSTRKQMFHAAVNHAGKN